MAASASILMKLPAPLRKHSEASTLSSCGGSSASSKLMAVGGQQYEHEGLNEDAGVPAEPGNGTILRGGGGIGIRKETGQRISKSRIFATGKQ
jgi:hypothetical protein